MPTDPPRTRELKPGFMRRAFLVVASALSLLMAAGAAFGFSSIQLAQHIINQNRLPGIEPGVVSPLCWKSGCNFLVMGTDSRVGLSHSQQVAYGNTSQVGGLRSDTIMVVHVDASTQHVTILQFPRDLWVNIPGYGMNKINSAIDFGGPNLTAKTIEQLTGLHINHIVVVDIAGFEKIVNQIGGVTICTNRPLVDSPAPYLQQLGDYGSGLNLPAGCHNLNGLVAQEFVRARSVQGDCISDFARIARQQQFLRALMYKILSPSEWTHALSLIPDVLKNLQTDQGLKVIDLLKLAHELQGISTGATDFRVVPSTLGWATVGGLKLSILNPTPQAPQLFGDLRNGRPLGDLGKQLPYTFEPANTKVLVYDDNAGTPAQSVYNTLGLGGYDLVNANGVSAGGSSSPVPGASSGSAAPPTAVPSPGAQASATPSPFPGSPVVGSYPGVTKSVILFAKGQDQAAAQVQGYFPNLKTQQVNAALPGGAAVVVVITQGYTPPKPGSGKQPTAAACPYTSG